MNSCELPTPVTASVPTDPPASRVMRFLAAGSPGEAHAWQGVQAVAYKPSADHHCGVIRNVLVGEMGERTAFHLRYFEIAPSGFTTLERHEHEHVVVVLRGQGEVRLGEQVHPLGNGDAVYVAPCETHQFRNTSADEPFGFLCVVDARRDAPTPTTG